MECLKFIYTSKKYFFIFARNFLKHYLSQQSVKHKMKTHNFILCSTVNSSKFSSLSKGVFLSTLKQLFLLPARPVFCIRR